MFASPHISRLPPKAVGAYLKFLSALMNTLPVNALDPAAATKKRFTQSHVMRDDVDSDSDGGPSTTVTMVASFNEPPLPKLDPKTVKRLGSVPSTNHITALFNVASKSDTVLLDYVVFLLSLVIVWPSQRDSLLNTVAGLGSGGLIRMLYRQYVLRSQLGQSNASLSGGFFFHIWATIYLDIDSLRSNTLLALASVDSPYGSILSSPTYDG